MNHHGLVGDEFFQSVRACGSNPLWVVRSESASQRLSVILMLANELRQAVEPLQPLDHRSLNYNLCGVQRLFAEASMISMSFAWSKVTTVDRR